MKRKPKINMMVILSALLVIAIFMLIFLGAYHIYKAYNQSTNQDQKVVSDPQQPQSEQPSKPTSLTFDDIEFHEMDGDQDYLIATMKIASIDTFVENDLIISNGFTLSSIPETIEKLNQEGQSLDLDQFQGRYEQQTYIQKVIIPYQKNALILDFTYQGINQQITIEKTEQPQLQQDIPHALQPIEVTKETTMTVSDAFMVNLDSLIIEQDGSTMPYQANSFMKVIAVRIDIDGQQDVAITSASLYLDDLGVVQPLDTHISSEKFSNGLGQTVHGQGQVVLLFSTLDQDVEIALNGYVELTTSNSENPIKVKIGG